MLCGLLDIVVAIVHLLQLLGHLEELLLEVDCSGSGSTGVVPALSHHLRHLTQQLDRGGRGMGRDEKGTCKGREVGERGREML